MHLKPLALYKSNAQIKDYAKQNRHFENITDKRKSISIAAIDDEPFLPESNLRSFGYIIKQIGDIKGIYEVKEFQIILCDLMGVGMHFNESSQGASLIEEIRNNYPSKVVIAYTGSSLGSQQARLARESADYIIKKDADISDWKDVLDDFVDQVIDPFYIWGRIRLRLIEMDIDTKNILLLEDSYVRGVLSRDSNFSDLNRTAKSIDIKGDARSVVQSIVGSAIYAAIFGP